jgi:hypothetical protein
VTMNVPRTDDRPKYEPVAINVRVPVLLALGLAVLIGGTLAGLWWLDRTWTGSDTAHEVVSPDAAVPRRQPLGGDAPLSSRQRQERSHYEAEQQALLTSYGWIDQQAGVARVPIARAMELLQQRESTEP